MIKSGNPWALMWTDPKGAIRSLIKERRGKTVYVLSVAYVLQNFFSYANWWSLGVKNSSSSVALSALILSLILAPVWLYFMSFVYYCSGKLFKGKALFSHILTTVGFTKLPFSIALGMWLSFILLAPEHAFIHALQGPSSIFIYFIGASVRIWALVLFWKALQEVQGFSSQRAFWNILSVWIFLSLIFFSFYFIFRSYF